MNLVGSKKKPSVISISKLSLSPAQKVKFHRKQAVTSLNKGNFTGFRFHSKKVANLNIRLSIARMKMKRGI